MTWQKLSKIKVFLSILKIKKSHDKEKNSIVLYHTSLSLSITFHHYNNNMVPVIIMEWTKKVSTVDVQTETEEEEACD